MHRLDSNETVEVCMVAYDASDFIASAVASIADWLPKASLAIADNSPNDESTVVASHAAASLGLQIRAFHDPTNPGFAVGSNRLAATSAADVLLFLNPDAQLATPVPASTTGILGAHQVGSDGLQQKAFGRDFRVRDEVLRSWGRRRPRPSGVAGEPGFVGGAALLIRRELFLRIGGFDESYFLFYEDIDLCHRVSAAGLPVAVDDAWIVHHATGTSARRQLAQALTSSYQSGRHFHRTHAHSVRGYDAFVAADALARATLWTVVGRRSNAQAYRTLARDAAREFRRRAGPG